MVNIWINLFVNRLWSGRLTTTSLSRAIRPYSTEYRSGMESKSQAPLYSLTSWWSMWNAWIVRIHGSALMRNCSRRFKLSTWSTYNLHGKTGNSSWRINGFPSLQSVLQAFPAPVRWESWDESLFCSSSNFRAISGSEMLSTQASAIPFYDLRQCNFSTIFSLFSWSGYTL